MNAALHEAMKEIVGLLQECALESFVVNSLELV